MFIYQKICLQYVEYKYRNNIMHENEDYGIEKKLSESDKLYLGACAIFAVGLIFMASTKFR